MRQRELVISLLRQGPLTMREMQEKSGKDENALAREDAQFVLRCLAHAGVVRVLEPDETCPCWRYELKEPLLAL